MPFTFRQTVPLVASRSFYQIGRVRYRLVRTITHAVDPTRVAPQNATVISAALRYPDLVGPAEVRRYHEEGYLLLRGVLDPDAELARLRDAYVVLMDHLGECFLRAANSPYLEGFADRPMPERFGVALGASGGEFLDHLDPALRAGSSDYRFRADLPTAQIPELFALMRAPALLDALEPLLGAEIEVAPGYHVNHKLGSSQLELTRAAAAAAGREIFHEAGYHSWHVLQTPWHADVPWLLADGRRTPVVTAWIPTTEATVSNGALMVVPGSHRQGIRMAPFPEEELQRGIALETEPGDVILFDNKLLHASAPIRDANSFRWAFNFRYLPAGQANGRPYLPGFLARSTANPERVFSDPRLWAAMWRAALLAATQYAQRVPSAATTGLHEARAFSKRWRELTADPEGWQELDDKRVWDFPARWWGRVQDRLGLG